MKYLVLSILLLTSTDPLKIGKINRIKKEAREAYTSANYKTAVTKYKYLIDSLQVNEDEVMINLANSYFHLKDTANAFTSYQSLTGSTNNEIRSRAHQQTGIMNHQQGKLEEALHNFKQAIKADPLNGSARYDYEMLKKKMEEKKKQDENKQKNDKNKNDKQQKPSEFAKKLKAQAEALAAQFRFNDAYNLMVEGAQKDASVHYYDDFTGRLKDVSQINESK